MSRSLMPKAFVDELNANPYVEKATVWSVTFTEEFKRKAYEEYSQGKSMRDIFTDCGFAVRKLGRGRIQNFRNRLMSRSDDEHGFADRRKDKSLQTPPGTEAQMMKRIRELEHRNAYLEQENDFLKKIHFPEESCDGKAVKQK